MRTKHGFLTIETRRLPLVDVVDHLPRSETPMLEDYREAFEDACVASRGEPVAYLLDMRDFNPTQITAAVRAGCADLPRVRRPVPPVSVAEARVITNPLTRYVVTAFDWLTNANKWPCRQFRAPEEAERWRRDELRKPRREGRAPRPDP